MSCSIRSTVIKGPQKDEFLDWNPLDVKPVYWLEVFLSPSSFPFRCGPFTTVHVAFFMPTQSPTCQCFGMRHANTWHYRSYHSWCGAPAIILPCTPTFQFFLYYICLTFPCIIFFIQWLRVYIVMHYLIKSVYILIHTGANKYPRQSKIRLISKH